MAFDNHSNFGAGLVATPPSPPTSGTSISVQPGQGALFPAAPFNVIVFPSSIAIADAPDTEIVRVTSKGSGDNWTIVRAQESTSARAIAVGDQIQNSITVKVITDIETAVATLQKQTSGSIALGNGVDHGTVTGLGLSFTPSRVMLSISRPSGALNIWANDVAGSLSSDGFSFELSGLTDSTSYVLNYAIFP